MSLQANPPPWLAKNKEIKRTWQRFIIRSAEKLTEEDARKAELLDCYVRAVSGAAYNMPATMNQIGSELDRSVRLAKFTDVRRDIHDVLHRAKRINQAADHLHKVAKLCRTELLDGQGITDPDLRSLIQSVLPIGGKLLAENAPTPSDGKKTIIITR